AIVQHLLSAVTASHAATMAVMAVGSQRSNSNSKPSRWTSRPTKWLANSLICHRFNSCWRFTIKR
ncbi:MAG: hypothetical protein K2X78_15360, partial [Burkholderiaceae bacterium]|nr:hypothetical protein [Burkholderiaceae bacterium]